MFKVYKANTATPPSPQGIGSRTPADIKRYGKAVFPATAAIGSLFPVFSALLSQQALG